MTVKETVKCYKNDIYWLISAALSAALQNCKFANKDIKEDECFKDGGWIVGVPGGNRKIFLRGGICQSMSSEEEEVEGTKVD